MTRADVLKQFGINKGDGFTRPEGAMADEIVWLRAILAALRGPSEAVVLGANTGFPFAADMIRAAIAAAEKEVGA